MGHLGFYHLTLFLQMSCAFKVVSLYLSFILFRCLRDLTFFADRLDSHLEQQQQQTEREEGDLGDLQGSRNLFAPLSQPIRPLAAMSMVISSQPVWLDLPTTRRHMSRSEIRNQRQRAARQHFGISNCFASSETFQANYNKKGSTFKEPKLLLDRKVISNGVDIWIWHVLLDR